MKDPWKYPQRPQHFAKAGEFVAWISGSGSRSDRAAAAIRVEKVDKSEASYEAIMPSRAGSTCPRAFLGAVIDALEVVPVGSTVEVRTFDQNTASA